MEAQKATLLTPEVRALIGKESEVIEMYGTIDEESIRRYVHGIPDQDPRHWDVALANPVFGGVTTPPLMVTYVVGRKPPWEPDSMDEVMTSNPMDDSGGGMERAGESLLDLRKVTGTSKHLQAGFEVEMFRHPKIGDRIFYQSKILDVQEKVGRRGEPFLLITRETRYWNQEKDVICSLRMFGIER